MASVAQTACRHIRKYVDECQATLGVAATPFAGLVVFVNSVHPAATRDQDVAATVWRVVRHIATTELLHLSESLDPSSSYLRQVMLTPQTQRGSLASAEVALPTSVARALALIEYCGCRHDMSLRGVARHIGLSECYLDRLLTKHTGASFKHHVVRVRMSRATTLLANTDKAVKEIAFDVGFARASSFDRAFKLSCGCSPQRWRLRRRQVV